MDFLDLAVLNVNVQNNASFAKTSNKGYHFLQQWRNVTSYSNLEVLHSCPRKWQLNKQDAYRKALTQTGEGIQQNIDFAFGHAVGAGVQGFLLTKDADDALFQCFMAWRAVFDDELPKKNKSLWQAVNAVESFINLYKQSDLSDWELATFDNGRVRGVEIAYEIDCENGYKHYGHIDLVMRNTLTGKLAVFEIKTHGFRDFEEALYGNSAQGEGYAAILDALVPGLASYTVKYLAYSAPSEEWHHHDFAKSVRSKTEYLLDLVTDHSIIARYEQMEMFPRRGGSCMAYNRRCQYYNECTLAAPMDLPVLPADQSAEEVDFKFTLSQLVGAQKEQL